MEDETEVSEPDPELHWLVDCDCGNQCWVPPCTTCISKAKEQSDDNEA
jgi:hypothetical protein